jgi:hypothetical protein
MNNMKVLFTDFTVTDDGVRITLCHWLLSSSHEGKVNPQMLLF